MMEILVQGLQFVGKHGITKEEQDEGSIFVADAVVHYEEDASTLEPDLDAALDLTLDYRKISEVILKHGVGPSVMLVETLAKRMIHDIFCLSSSVLDVDLTIRKKARGVPGNPEWVGVRLRLNRQAQESRRNLGSEGL